MYREGERDIHREMGEERERGGRVEIERWREREMEDRLGSVLESETTQKGVKVSRPH